MLSDEQIAEMMRDTWGCASIAPRHALEFARAVEAEVRKQDDALIRQQLVALEYAYRPLCMCFAGCDNCDTTKEIPDAQAAITAARARLGEKT
jgi:hypothetical protein